MTNFLLETPGVKITRIRCCSHEYEMVDTDATKGMNIMKNEIRSTPTPGRYWYLGYLVARRTDSVK